MPKSFQSSEPGAIAQSKGKEVRDRIIGLGESSVRKSYYPQLQEKIRALEEKQQELMDTVRNLEERETELERAIGEKNILLREVHHRVKNNLQIIGSLLSLGSDTLETEEQMRSFDETRRRIDTIALVYNQLLQEGQYTDLDLRQLIRMVSDTLFLETGNPAIKISFNFTSVDLIVDMDRAVPFALIVSELVSNALRHGCTQNGGTIAVTLTAVGEPTGNNDANTFSVEDKGPGLVKDEANADQRLGLALVDMLARQLKAEWKLEPGSNEQGMRATLFFPGCC